MAGWPGPIAAVTLVVPDKDEARRFYVGVLGLETVFEDDVSVVLRFGTTLINLLARPAAFELFAPDAPGEEGAGPRTLLTVEVDSVDDEAARLVERGVTLLNGPMDRPWGIRTVSFVAPGGHAWELGAPITP